MFRTSFFKTEITIIINRGLQLLGIKHAASMLMTETCCCMSGTMTGGKSREWRKMNSVVSAMTGQNRTPISLHRIV